jgi:hypothetical protein
VASGNTEHRYQNYEALSHTNNTFKYNWVSDHNGFVPDGAVIGGIANVDKRNFYIGKTVLSNLLLPGKIDPKNRALYVSTGNREYRFTHYQTLVSYLPTDSYIF